MTIKVFAQHAHIGARVEGVDLTYPVPAKVFAEIETAFNRHAVLIFPNQPISEEQQIAFSLLFGPLEHAPNYAGEERRELTHAEITDISNLDSNGRILDSTNLRRLLTLSTRLWHTDSSFKNVPARASLLSAREIPQKGGETEFADLRAAYDALPENMQHKLEGLVAEHNFFYSHNLVASTDLPEDIQREFPPVPQVVVRTHAGSGRKTLYLASHASHIIGWPIQEGRKLLRELIDFATQARFVYQHRWCVGDLVIWDDRCTMHRGRAYDDTGARRDMRRTTVSDEVNSVELERALHAFA